MQEANRASRVFSFIEWFGQGPRPLCIFIRHEPPAQQDPDWQHERLGVRVFSIIQPANVHAVRTNMTEMEQSGRNISSLIIYRFSPVSKHGILGCRFELGEGIRPDRQKAAPNS